MAVYCNEDNPIGIQLSIHVSLEIRHMFSHSWTSNLSIWYLIVENQSCTQIKGETHAKISRTRIMFAIPKVVVETIVGHWKLLRESKNLPYTLQLQLFALIVPYLHTRLILNLVGQTREWGEFLDSDTQMCF